MKLAVCLSTIISCLIRPRTSEPHHHHMLKLLVIISKNPDVLCKSLKLAYGNYSCSNANKYGSVCFATCNPGYGLVKVPQIPVRCDQIADYIYGDWNGTLAACKR